MKSDAGGLPVVVVMKWLVECRVGRRTIASDLNAAAAGVAEAGGGDLLAFSPPKVFLLQDQDATDAHAHSIKHHHNHTKCHLEEILTSPTSSGSLPAGRRFKSPELPAKLPRTPAERLEAVFSCLQVDQQLQFPKRRHGSWRSYKTTCSDEN